jgi:hypothetical protein
MAINQIANLDPMDAVSDSMKALPGGDLIERGIADLHASRETTRPCSCRSVRAVYMLLARETGDAAHSAYNALIRRLVSFERTARCAN